MCGLIDEMREKGISPNVYTYNIMIGCLCKSGRTEEAIPLLNEMLQKGIIPNMHTFELLIKSYCRTGEFRPAQEVFDIASSICGHSEALYALMFNEFLAGGEIVEAKQFLETAIDKHFDLGSFLYKDLIDKLCKVENLEGAHDILIKMMHIGYRFDPASFMPVIDGLNKLGQKHVADELTERMLEMVIRSSSELSDSSLLYRSTRVVQKRRRKSSLALGDIQKSRKSMATLV
ncbi:hypothetical protein H5410_005305 [Solanum commersonii]|uniref:Pentatricopeptide repeat-containing protein n=1 Tax=Solanum commersonii TaxID=4109 RepID=A0A9J6A7T6_SOLCO|nr:hypothetical protein H5410_005305 [Solanum commersonii]